MEVGWKNKSKNQKIIRYSRRVPQWSGTRVAQLFLPFPTSHTQLFIFIFTQLPSRGKGSVGHKQLKTIQKNPNENRATYFVRCVVNGRYSSETVQCKWDNCLSRSIYNSTGFPRIYATWITFDSHIASRQDSIVFGHKRNLWAEYTGSWWL